MDWVFEVVQDGQVVAEGSGPDKDRVLAEAAHYVRMYGQDGECRAYVRPEDADWVARMHGFDSNR